MTSKFGGAGHMSKQIRSWLITALLVFVALNILLAVIRPYLGFIMVGIVVITVAGILLRRR
jgi:hypothetical protein